MGNLLPSSAPVNPSQVVSAADVVVSVIESSNPDDIRDQLNALFAQMILDADALFDLNVSGAGSGYRFTVVALHGPAATFGFPAVLPGTRCETYMAGDAVEIAPAAMRAVKSFADAGEDLILHGLAGASAGNRWLGILIGLPPLPPP